MEPPSARVTTTLVLGLAVLMLNPPAIQRIDDPTPTVGMAPLYLWIVFWGLVVVGAFLWAALKDAFGLSNDQVPPELRDSAGASLGSATSHTESPATDGGSAED
jgi:hypothetical protein